MGTNDYSSKRSKQKMKDAMVVNPKLGANPRIVVKASIVDDLNVAKVLLNKHERNKRVDN